MGDDLQELLRRLKENAPQTQSQAGPQPSQNTAPQQSLWAQRSVSSTAGLTSPPAYSNIMQPASATGSPAPDTDRTNNLLNLLKFNGQAGQQQGQSSPMANLQNVQANRHSSAQSPSIQSLQGRDQRPLSAHGLMSNLQRQPSANIKQSPMVEKSDSQPNSGANPQDFLLGLLLKPKGPATQQTQQQDEAKAEISNTDVDNLTQSFAATKVDNTQRQFGSPMSSGNAFEAPQANQAGRFTYVNPFNELHTSSPLNHARSPKPDASNEPKKIEILKHSRDTTSSQHGEGGAPEAKIRKLGSNDTAGTAHQSVAEVLEGVGERVDKQVEKALAEATQPALKENDFKKENALKKEKIDNGNEAGDVQSSWESAEEEISTSMVEVYSLPMKPFISVQIKAASTKRPARPMRQDNYMQIATLKKDFDQIDRSLATASQTHIVYAQVATKKDNGGFRIIRQDSGTHKQVFRSSGERVFNVQLCTVEHDVETVLGTGVSGSVFWTSLAKSRGDLFADDDVEAQGFVMPAVQTVEENTSGSPVKTRAKMSSRHVEYFAIARGKHIFIITPDKVKEDAYCSSETRKVDSEKYFADHTLKINTGKAGKDFCWSEDDTVIASLDKNGRFKFWDVRELTTRACDLNEVKHDPVELAEPLWTMNAATSGSKPDEKPSVSSIMFLDKDRPMTKGCALRYVIIGFKQNHILQLWDLGLGKAVQEIRLPHEKDSDGICSISYHPTTCIITIGHPTRNSIYFIHLSAPKYKLPTMPQARYLSMLAQSDPSLAKPDSTAIMSGIREFSFARIGELRSVDMLRVPVENAGDKGTPEETLFELYIVHSKGVAGVSIKREDLGWDAAGKMVNPKDGLKEGVIEVTDLVPPQKAASETTGTTESPTKQATKQASVKKAETAKSATPTKPDIKKEPVATPSPAAANGVPRDSFTAAPSVSLPSTSTNPPLNTADSYSHAAQRSKSPNQAVLTPEASSKAMVAPTSTAIEPTVSYEGIDARIGQQFESLYQRLDADKRVNDAAAGARQDALLRLVSSTLTENVDASLNKIISARIERDVVPALTEVTGKVIDRKIAESLPKELNTSVAAAMKAQLSTTLQSTLKDKEIQRAISDITGNHVAAKVQERVDQLLQKQLPGMATQASQKMIADLESRLGQQQRSAEAQRQQDNAKIEELSNIVRTLSATMQDMAASQTAFQEQILKMQRENKSAPQPSANTGSDSASAEVQAEPEDQDVARMTQMLIGGRYEEATIQWISSDRQAEVFDKLFVRVNPSYLTTVSPLVALTVSAAVTSSFDTYVEQRLEWLDLVLKHIDVRDNDIRDVAPKIMDVIAQRLQGVYMQISETTPNDPTLRTVMSLNKNVQEIRRICQ
ncbi:unnamed protein product [Zymoseptoria tritici ST99CH_1A5]|uniref:EDC4-like protein pdc1 beta-propeller domain-containing protein n=1 Tax=Zymoseptoria tritici ST99CH_1A5 TaxID=1276529 RepID=A0A1Y6LE37_ZYMTR|nr:unnamed protein product [Zymoseptoria tritici ST99CH_1A5]